MSSGRGIVLAGGAGTRLHPVTRAVSKQLLPIYDKPMIYHPICTLMQAGIREVLIITTPEDAPRFRELLGDGSDWGVSFSYREQHEPRGIADALRLGGSFIGDQSVTLVLGDNLFHGEGLDSMLASAADDRATCFVHHVDQPQRYGVVELDDQGRVRAMVEKPERPPSNLAVTGLYRLPPDAVTVAEGLQPSARGELEIVDVLVSFLEQGRLDVHTLGRGHAWLDTGTHAALLEASMYVETLERRQGLKLACPEELAWRAGWIDDAALERAATALSGTDYGDYLRSLRAG